MIDAVLVLDKPASMTSHDVVNRLRRLTGERSIGHLGTLDPMATGVLPLVLGRYTRLAQFFHESRKVYEGEIRFGFATDTYDAEGEALEAPIGEPPTLEAVRSQLPQLRGRILQRPPAFSAKKVAGVAAYKLARRERPVELQPVEVEVFRFDVRAVFGDRASFVAEVSAGTYIRSLVQDLGVALGCGAHLAQLRRTQAGEFTLRQAVKLEGLEAAKAQISSLSECSLSDILAAAATTSFIHPRLMLSALPNVTATPEQLAAIRNGRAVNLPEFSSAPLVKVFANQHLLVGVAQRIAGTLFHPKVVLYGSNEALPL
jgi:tRNA pseudouridine55 synthase